MTRRHPRRAILLASLGLAAHPASAAMPRVAVLDWGLAETAIALGIAPVAAAELRGYATWVREPAMPPGVLDLGLRGEPNLELLDRADPELVLSTPQFAPLLPRLERVAPVASFATYVPGGDPVARSAEIALALGQKLGREDAAVRLRDAADAAFAAARDRLGPRPAPLLVASFVDPRHLRVFGPNSLFGAVLRRLGLANGWTGATSFWGFATVPLERMADPPEASLLLLEPLPPAVAGSLARNPLWAALPAVRAGRVARMPPCWAFGGLPSAMRFARLLPNV
jgi:ABC-type Fe3+-hydroxamate transport system substrate-binding protein